jgi:anti-anti-sigma factor
VRCSLSRPSGSSTLRNYSGFGKLIVGSANASLTAAGRRPGTGERAEGVHNVLHHEKARTWPDLVLYRFGAALVFFNAPYFKKRVLEMAATHPGIKWLIVDGSTINSVDSTGAAILEALSEDLRTRGIRLGFANLRTEVRRLLERSGVQAALGDGALFPTLKSAVDSRVSGGFAETSENGTEPS